MIDDKEKEKIFDLIKKGYSDYKIEKITGHSHAIIPRFREEFFKNLKYPASKDEENFDSSIDFFKSKISEFEKHINTHKLEEKRKKELEKSLEYFKKILHSDVYERISKEREDAIKIRDQEWIKIIEQQYVKKEILKEKEENYENKLIEKDLIIENLKNENKKKEDTIIRNQAYYNQKLSDKQNEIDCLKAQYSDIFNKNIDLIDKNNLLNNYINNRLEKDVILGQQQLNREIQFFYNEKREFENRKDKANKVIKNRILDIKEIDSNLIIRERNVERAERMIKDFNNKRL